MRICGLQSVKVRVRMRAHGTLDTKELPHFQRCATHPREFGHKARQVRLGHHERGWILGGVSGCR